MNKKGLWAANVYIDTISIIAFVLFVVVFFVLFSMQGNDEKVKIQGKSDQVSANIVLLNYLRTPVSVDNKTVKMSELIALVQNGANYSGVFVNSTAESLDVASYTYSDGKNKITRYYSVAIPYMDVNIDPKSSVSGYSRGTCSSSTSDICTEVAHSFVPVRSNMSVEVKLYQWEARS